MSALSATARRDGILALLGAGEAPVSELAGRLGVTPMTIRRDLDHLAGQGKVTRTHGGAFLAAPALAAFAFQDRNRARLEEKRAIAREARRLVEPGMTVVLDSGTTTLELARLLGGVPRLTVLTNSLAVAAELLAHDGLQLVVLGGTVGRNAPDLSGPLTIENLAAFRANLAFLGADAMDGEGFYTGRLEVAQVSRAMIAHSERAVLLADGGKYGAAAFVRIAGWDALAAVISDDSLAAGARARVPGLVLAHGGREGAA